MGILEIFTHPLFVAFVTLVAADYYLIRRSALRSYAAIEKRIMAKPTIRKFNELVSDPAFDVFVCKTIRSIDTLNKLAEKIEEKGVLAAITEPLDEKIKRRGLKRQPR